MLRSVLYIDPPAFCTAVEGLVAPALRERPVAVAAPGADRGHHPGALRRGEGGGHHARDAGGKGQEALPRSHSAGAQPSALCPGVECLVRDPAPLCAGAGAQGIRPCLSRHDRNQQAVRSGGGCSAEDPAGIEPENRIGAGGRCRREQAGEPHRIRGGEGPIASNRPTAVPPYRPSSTSSRAARLPSSPPIPPGCFPISLRRCGNGSTTTSSS